MLDTYDRALLHDRVRDLDARIQALRVRRQYATNPRYGWYLDGRITALQEERAELVETMRVER